MSNDIEAGSKSHLLQISICVSSLKAAIKSCKNTIQKWQNSLRKLIGKFPKETDRLRLLNKYGDILAVQQIT